MTEYLPDMRHAIHAWTLSIALQQRDTGTKARVLGWSPNPGGDPLSYLWIHAFSIGTGSRVRVSCRSQVLPPWQTGQRYALPSGSPALPSASPYILLPSRSAVFPLCLHVLTAYSGLTLVPAGVWAVLSPLPGTMLAPLRSSEKSVLWISDNQFGCG